MLKQTLTEIVYVIAYKYTACSNSTWRDVADIMDSGHRLGTRMNRFTVHEMLCGLGTTDEGNINLCNDLVHYKAGTKHDSPP